MGFVVYRENYIPGVGSPLLIVVMGQRTRNGQAVETYFFICGESKVFLPEIRDWCFDDQVDDSIVAEAEFIAEAVAAADELLENLMIAKFAPKYAGYLSARNGFQKAANAELEIMNLAARHNFRDQLRKVAEITQDEALTKLIETRCRYTLTFKAIPTE